jgi:hypothetical protein
MKTDYEGSNPREVPTCLEIGASGKVVENEGREASKRTRGPYTLSLGR